MHTQLNKDLMNCANVWIFSVGYPLKQFLFSRDGFSI